MKRCLLPLQCNESHIQHAGSNFLCIRLVTGAWGMRIKHEANSPTEFRESGHLALFENLLICRMTIKCPVITQGCKNTRRSFKQRNCEIDISRSLHSTYYAYIISLFCVLLSCRTLGCIWFNDTAAIELSAVQLQWCQKDSIILPIHLIT